jgi:hypothetical protein
MNRPPVVVLPDEALVPDRNVIAPAPNTFTHVTVHATPYWFDSADREARPDGELAARARVVLLVDEGDGRCRVVDERGLYVQVSGADLAAL